MPLSAKIFVGGIPQEVTEDDLCETVSLYGNVLHVYYDRATEQNSRGWAFITYGKIESAYRAITCLHSRRILPNSQWPLEVKFAESKQGNRSSIYKNNKGCHDIGVNKNKEWQLVTSDVSSYKYNIGKSERGVYPNCSHTALVPHQLNEKEMCLSLRHLTTNLFIFHVPPQWSDQDLYDYFAPFGHIVSAHVQKDANGRNRGFGFVNYANPLSAFSAIKKMNGFHVAGKYLKVQLKKGDEKYALMGCMLQRNMVQHNVIQNDTVQNTVVYNTRLQNSIMQNNIMQNNIMQNNIMQNNRMQNSSMHTPHLMVHHPTMLPGQYLLFTHPLMATSRQPNPVPFFTYTPMHTKN